MMKRVVAKIGTKLLQGLAMVGIMVTAVNVKFQRKMGNYISMV